MFKKALSASHIVPPRISQLCTARTVVTLGCAPFGAGALRVTLYSCVRLRIQLSKSGLDAPEVMGIKARYFRSIKVSARNGSMPVDSV